MEYRYTTFVFRIKILYNHISTAQYHIESPHRTTRSMCIVHSVQILCIAAGCMPGLLRSLTSSVTRSFFHSMASADYVAGTHSMAFVTVPNEEVGKTLAR